MTLIRQQSGAGHAGPRSTKGPTIVLLVVVVF